MEEVIWWKNVTREDAFITRINKQSGLAANARTLLVRRFPYGLLHATPRAPRYQTARWKKNDRRRGHRETAVENAPPAIRAAAGIAEGDSAARTRCPHTTASCGVAAWAGEAVKSWRHDAKYLRGARKAAAVRVPAMSMTSVYNHQQIGVMPIIQLTKAEKRRPRHAGVILPVATLTMT